MTRRLLPIACLVLLAGCGAQEPPAVKARHHRVAVTATDFRYTPQTIRAAPGELRLDIVNKGRLAHTLWISRGPTHIVARASSLLPGDRTSKTVKVRKGTYKFFCALSNHEELGMYGTLVVK
jgi:plastocyanin